MVTAHSVDILVQKSLPYLPEGIGDKVDVPKFIHEFRRLPWEDVHGILTRSYLAYTQFPQEQQQSLGMAEKEYNLLVYLATHSSRDEVRTAMHEYPTADKVRHVALRWLQNHPTLFQNRRVKITKIAARTPLRDFYKDAGDLSENAFDFLHTYQTVLPCTYEKAYEEIRKRFVGKPEQKAFSQP